MSLVQPSEVRWFIATSLDDGALQWVIDKVEADVTAVLGEPQDDAGDVELTETLRGEGKYLFLKRPIASVTSVTETYSTDDTRVLTTDDYQIWATEGKLERLTHGAKWPWMVEVVYKPTDDRPRRRQMIVDLVRLVIERTAMQSESIAGEYSYKAPEWEAEYQKVMDRMRFQML